MRAELLYVISCYFNHRRNPHLLRNARAWLERSQDSGARVIFVEHQIGERPYEFDPMMFPHVQLIQLRGTAAHELWLKEALLKRALGYLPEDARYVCWEDADVEHARKDWAPETVQMLQNHRVGQTWTHAIDFGPGGEVMTNEWGHDVDRSFAAAWRDGDVKCPAGDVLLDKAGKCMPQDGYYGSGETGPVASKRDRRQHYGYSWAARRDVLQGVGFIDWLVTGSADYHMALAFAGLTSRIGEESSDGYRRRIREYARNCNEFVRQDIGVVPGTLMAHFHGPKNKRFYISRHSVMTASGFDPDRDLSTGGDGLPQLVGDNRVLRDGLRRYFMRRNEEA